MQNRIQVQVVALVCIVVAITANLVTGGELSYTGEYRKLERFNQTISPSHTGYGPLTTYYWMAPAAADNQSKEDCWFAMTWPYTIDFSRLYVSPTHQLGAGGGIATWEVQYTADGGTSWNTVQTFNDPNAKTVTLTGNSGNGLRIFYPETGYTVGTANKNWGPGVNQWSVWGSVAAGLDSTDPAFDLIASPTYNRTAYLPSVTMENNGTGVVANDTGAMVDNVVSTDGPRAGWQTSTMDGEEAFVIDIGPTTQAMFLTGVILHGGNQYNWLVNDCDVYVSKDGLNWGTSLGKAIWTPTSGWLRLDWAETRARYVKLTNFSKSGSPYVLGTEVQVLGYVVPEPASLSLLAGAALVALSRPARRRAA